MHDARSSDLDWPIIIVVQRSQMHVQSRKQMPVGEGECEVYLNKVGYS